MPRLLRRFPALILVIALCLLTGPGLSPARADDVATAQARVDRLQKQVVTTTKTLSDGTRKWEQDKASLVAVNEQLAATRVRIVAAQKIADDNTKRLADMARQLYMSPSPNHLELAMTKGPQDFTDAVQSLGSLGLVADSRTVIIHRATAARVELQVEEQAAKALAKQASDLALRSAKRMRDLQALAHSMAVQLSSAQSALVHAREVEAARIAAAAQAARVRLARAQQEREQARALRAAAAAARAFVATCQGMPVEGQQNGFLDPASLCPIWEAPGMSLKGTAAEAFNRMSKYHFATLGTPICVTGGYRTYQRQVELYAEKPGLAAVPGTSEHGWGQAADLCGGIENTGTAAHQWMQVHAADFGWFHPAWAEPSGSKPEPWHWEFNG